MGPATLRHDTGIEHAEFSRDGALITATPGFLPGGLDDLPDYLGDFASLDGQPVAFVAIDAVADRLCAGAATAQAEDPSGRAWTLCSHPTAAGGFAIVAAPAPASAAPSDDDARASLNDTLRALHQGCALFDADGRLILCNDLYRDMNAAVREFITPGVYFETILREMTRRRLVRQAVGREGAWVAQILEAVETDDEFELERVDGLITSVTVGPTSAGGFVISEVDITERRRAEQSAKASEQLLSTILEASPANLCMSEIGDGTIIYASPSCTALFGPFTSARDQFSDPLDRGDFLTELLASGEVDDFAAEARRTDGSTFPALFSARVIDYRGEEVMVSTVVDLTDQVAAEAKVKDASIRLRDAIEALSEGFILYDFEERVVMANQRFLEMNAPYAHLIVPGTHTSDLLNAAIDTDHFVDARGWLQDYTDELERGQGGSHRSFDFQMTDGTWISSLRRPTREGGFVITWLDVTERKMAEAAEREAYALPERMLNACPVALVMSDFETAENTYRNAEDTALFGETRHPSEFWAKPAERAEFLDRIARDHRVNEMQVSMTRADGTIFPALVSARTVDYRGAPYMVTYTFDLTDRVAMERELTSQQEMLHQSEKLSALGELLAGVAHELNNPLSVVVGHALMLAEEATDPAQLKRIDKIAQAAERCSRIIKTFLAMARQRPTQLEPISMNTVVETAVEVAGYGLHRAGIEIALDLADPLPPVKGDADQLAQVLANLLVNAEHALAGLGKKGKLSISTRVSDNGGDVIVDVRDNGPGIPDKIRARIFEPFFTTKTVGEGTGIGLAFCHRIVESHNGAISVHEAETGGAHFKIVLAAQKAVASSDDRTPDPASARGDVLVVDDEADVAELIAGILKKDGYRVTVAPSAETALELLPGAFDAVLSDVNMPGLGGREFLAIVEEKWPALSERVGFITGDTMSSGAEQFLRSSGKRHLEKPVTPSDLRKLTADIIGG